MENLEEQLIQKDCTVNELTLSNTELREKLDIAKDNVEMANHKYKRSCNRLKELRQKFQQQESILAKRRSKEGGQAEEQNKNVKGSGRSVRKDVVVE